MAAMVEKYAGKIKKLHVWSCPKDLDVPALPKLESLTFECDASVPLFKAGQPNIHTLELISSDVYDTTEYVDLENSQDHKIENLMLLILLDIQSFSFFWHNANNLVSLVLEYVNNMFIF